MNCSLSFTGLTFWGYTQNKFVMRWRKEMLTGKNVILGVTGGIAAYKSADLAS